MTAFPGVYLKHQPATQRVFFPQPYFDSYSCGRAVETILLLMLNYTLNDLNYNPNSNFMNFNIDNVPLLLTYEQPNKNGNNSQQQGSATN